ncbi:hypothetical protein SARC_09006 [Sphaeroforma arctica JP610]|uniref:Uncharacterized protein n=1 Tax=Sphaeroforma arctica JP610 TaxID=667725 RepID=A0A0L0FP36_9EUKA|nr:hypothetical protein SARC_09006 [Sphaeroforma arctica JP610]KNC78570.1 hypothetical protein SARC_09006 [Sphaeroforma arctica JP610]|eukprot:XP_014152472.1 hypothetical protein SARC_09006 [Sphaeroforma arctica JP610]
MGCITRIVFALVVSITNTYGIHTGSFAVALTDDGTLIGEKPRNPGYTRHFCAESINGEYQSRMTTRRSGYVCVSEDAGDGQCLTYHALQACYDTFFKDDLSFSRPAPDAYTDFSNEIPNALRQCVFLTTTGKYILATTYQGLSCLAANNSVDCQLFQDEHCCERAAVNTSTVNVVPYSNQRVEDNLNYCSRS